MDWESARMTRIPVAAVDWGWGWAPDSNPWVGGVFSVWTVIVIVIVRP
jgi:hypothetical protein